MAVSIKITNLSQIKSAFNRAPALMAKELSIAIRKVVINIQRHSMMNTPVQTGRLRASHYTNFAPLRGEVGTQTNYDRFVHDGTRFMKARPYLTNAVESEEQTTERFFTEAVDNVLKDIGRNV